MSDKNTLRALQQHNSLDANGRSVWYIATSMRYWFFVTRPKVGVLFNLPVPTTSVVSTLQSPPSPPASRCPWPTYTTKDNKGSGDLQRVYNQRNVLDAHFMQPIFTHQLLIQQLLFLNLLLWTNHQNNTWYKINETKHEQSKVILPTSLY